jgi:hypothetical protein
VRSAETVGRSMEIVWSAFLVVPPALSLACPAVRPA